MLSLDYFSYGTRHLITQNMLTKLMAVILYGLQIAKVEACSLVETSLNLLRDYLSNRKQRTKIGSSFSDWRDVICGIPQGSVLGPLFFNNFINDMILFVSKYDICNFPDVSAISSCGKRLGDILHDLKFDLGHILKWFEVNSLKPNSDKFQFMILEANTDIKVNLFLNGNKIPRRCPTWNNYWW